MDSDEEDDNDGDDYGDGGTLPWVAREVERRAEIERQKMFRIEEEWRKMPWGRATYRIDVSLDTSAARENTIPPLSDYEELVTPQCTDNKHFSINASTSDTAATRATTQVVRAAKEEAG